MCDIWCNVILFCHIGFLMEVTPSPPLGHIWDVILVWKRGNINGPIHATVSCTVIIVHSGMGSSYRLVDWIGFDLALYLPSTFLSWSSCCNVCRNKNFHWAEPGGIAPWCHWLIIILQCYDSVRWVIWPVPVKSSPEMTCQLGCCTWYVWWEQVVRPCCLL